jgi:tight adherence protein B
MLSLGALLMLLGYHMLHDMLISVAMGIAGIAIPYLYLIVKKRKRLEEFEGQLPEALDMIVNALKAGFSFDSSLRMVVQEIPDPLGLEMAITYEEQNLGIELSEALNNLKMRVPSDDLEIFLTALLIHKKTGGNLAEVLNKTAKTIRDRLRLKREVKTKTVHGRFSGMVLILLPIIMAIAIYLLNPEYVMVLIKEKIGNYLLIAAILMQIIGIFVIRKIVNIRL